MKRSRILLFGILIILSGLWIAESDGYIEPSAGVTVATPLDDLERVTEQANFIALKAEFHKDGLQMLFDGNYRYDSAYDMDDEYSDEARDAYRFHGAINQALLGLRWADWECAIGYQKIAWGEADDLRIVDVVNPLDFKNFVLFDLNDYRISQKMVRIEGALNDAWELETLFIVKSESNDYPPSGSEFASPLLPEAMGNGPLKNEFGIRASAMFLDMDISLYGFTGYEDAPLFLIKGETLQPKYAPVTMLGTSFNLPIDAWVVRGEAAFFPDRRLGTDQGEEALRQMIGSFLGLDYLYRDMILGVQVADRYIHEWDDALVDEKWDPYMTASVEGVGFNGTLTTRVAFTRSLAPDSGGLSQLKVTYQPNRHWSLRFAIDIMDGDTQNLFGQFSGKDRLWSSLSYTF